MRIKRLTYQDRDEIAAWYVSIWRDAISEGFDQSVLLRKFARLKEDKRYKRMTQRDREYALGYERCYQREVVDRQFLECGSWVKMPDGSIEWFGVAERLGKSTMELNTMYPQLADYGIHRYIHENSVPDRSGIYWVARDGRWKGGEKPYFIPDVTNKQ